MTSSRKRLRWQSSERATIRDPQAWLVTTTTHAVLDRLRILKRERERYDGPWIPEPVVRDASADPEEHAQLGRPLRRFPSSSRAAGARRAGRVDPPRRLRASARGDRRNPKAHRGGRAPNGPSRASARPCPASPLPRRSPCGGSARRALKVVRLLLGVRTKFWAQVRLEPATVNDAPGLVIRDTAGTPRGVIALATDGNAITNLHVVVAPDKVARIFSRDKE